MDAAITFLQENPGGWSLAVLFLAAALEYVVPPFPADTIAIAGSLLVVSGSWPFWMVGAALVAGGTFGTAVQYGLGVLLLDDNDNLRGGRWIERLSGRGSVERFFELFRKYGVWVIAINRAVPGVRGVTFIAAGAARLPMARALLLGLVSNLGWSLGLLSLGVAVGSNWEKINDVLGVYQWVALGVLTVGVLAFLWARRRGVIGSRESDEG